MLSATGPALERLRSLLREEGGLIATLVGGGSASSSGGGVEGGADDRPEEAREARPEEAREARCEEAREARREEEREARREASGAKNGESPARVAASGPRTEQRAEQYELLVEAIYEGYLLHYGAPRVVRAADADLRVLAGDRLYAIGLARLVELGDTRAVAELADTIALSSLAQGAGDAPLADAVWAAGARAVGWGSSELHARAKELLARGSSEAFEAMRTSALGAAATP